MNECWQYEAHGAFGERRAGRVGYVRPVSLSGILHRFALLEQTQLRLAAGTLLSHLSGVVHQLLPTRQVKPHAGPDSRHFLKK